MTGAYGLETERETENERRIKRELKSVAWIPVVLLVTW